MRTITVLFTVVLLASCKADFVLVGQPPVPEVHLNQAVIGIKPGEVFQVQAVVAGSTDQRLSWESRQPLVATVDTAGIVHAIKPGNAIIVAAMRSNTAVRDSISVAVIDTTPGTIERGAVSILVLTHATQQAVDPRAVKGLIDVTSNYEIPAGVTVTDWRVRWNGEVLCSFPTTAVHGTFTCAIDTRQYVNGPATVRSELARGNAIVATATYQQLTIAN